MLGINPDEITLILALREKIPYTTLSKLEKIISKYGSVFLGKDPTHPRKDEILAELDFELHQQGYLSDFW